MKRFLALFCLVILNISFSQAAVTINVVESGGDVVATASGSINTAGLSGPRASFYKTGVVIGLDHNPTDPLSLMIVGPAADPDFWVGAIPPPSHFSTGAYFDDSSNGGTLAVGAFKSLRQGNAIYVPQGYSSGTALDGTSTWSSQTFASLGLTPGTYQWTWGSGESADSLTLVIGEPDSTYSVGGSVSGLTGTGLALQNNGTEVLAIAADGSFTFLTELTDSSAYLVTVSTQPTDQTCVVTDGSGMIAGADITNVAVTCTNNAFIDSALLSVDASKFYFDVVITDTAGETSGELIFRIATEGDGIGGSSSDKQRIAINFDTTSGAVTRSNEVQELGSPPNDRWMLGPITDLSITPSASDGWQIVGSVLHGTEPYVAGDIVSDVQFRLGTAAGTRDIHMRDVVVTAASVEATTYSVGGTVSGLSGTGLALQNNGGDTLVVAAAATNFTFVTELLDLATYAVTVSTQPVGQTCSISNGSGTIATADVTNVAVTCVTDTYSVGGTVSGLTGTGLALQNNGADTLAVAADGQFTFLTELTDSSSYAVMVSTQPTGQTCTVSNGSGTIATADVTNVAVTCVTDTYSVGGTVSGLTGTGLALQNNGADTLAVAADGPFTFLTELTDTSTYAVTISAQPTGQTCTVSNGSGTIATADATSIAVACVDNPIYMNEVPIPTLDRYGLALLMLLMMGIGAVGMRRFY